MKLSNLLKKLVVAVGLATASWSAMAENDIKVMYVGPPQAGPPVIMAQAFGQALSKDGVANSFVSHSDCVGSLKAINDNENVLFFMSDATTLVMKRRGDNCYPKFEPKDIVGTMSSSWHICKKPGTPNMSSKKFIFGTSTVLPGDGVVRDLNKRNGLGATNVGMKSSSQILAAVLSGDVDFGMINPGVAEPLMAEGKLSCPLTFIPQGTDAVPSKDFIGNTYDMTIPDLRCQYLMVLKTKDPKVREQVLKAAQGGEFTKFLKTNSYIDVQVDNFKTSDVENFNNRMVTTEKELY